MSGTCAGISDGSLEEEEMAKGRAKDHGSDSIAPPQPRALRSRKRECPSDEISKREHVPRQDFEVNDTVVNAKLTQCIQTPLQESTMPSVQPYREAQQPCLTEEDPATEGKRAGATSVSLKNATANVVEAQEETTFNNPNNDSQLKGLTTHTVNNAIQSGEDNEEISVEEQNRSPSQTCTEQLQVFVKPTEECNGACAAATFEEKPGAKENSQDNVERNQETSPEECSDVFTALGLPAKKKRRMGMRDLTEKERSHFLQAHKHQNGQDGAESAGKHICNNTADPVAQEDIVSSPPVLFSPFTAADCVTEQNDAESTLQPSCCDGNDRAETEGHVAVSTSDGTSAVCDPGYSEGKSSEAEGGIVPGPEQTDDSMSHPSTEEGLLAKQQQELQGGAAEVVAENPQEQMKDKMVFGDGSAEDRSPADSFYSSPKQNEETGRNWDSPLQVKRGTGDEEKEGLTFDAGDTDQAKAGASSTDTGERGPAQLFEAPVPPGGSERKETCDPDNEPGACTAPLRTVYPQTRDNTAGPFGSANLHYVSDSQLNTITLIEEEVMEREEDLGSQNCHDATDLICGLVRELSSLNQKVMATVRELESLRRSSKTSWSSL